MSEFGFEVDEIARLIKLVEKQGLSELAFEEDGRRIVIRGAGYESNRSKNVTHFPMLSGAVGTASETEVVYEADFDEPEEVADDSRIPVTTPMVGVFYRAPGPDIPNYVEIGDEVSVGQTIGMIEAMKVFSEIPSEHAGTVVDIIAQNGKLVKPGEPLIILSVD